MSSTETRSLFTILDDIVAALEPLRDEVPGLQLVPMMNGSPNPPSIDVYPGTPFQVPATFGSDQLFFTVRARVATADQNAGQRLLLRLLDHTDDASIAALLERCEPQVAVLEVSEYREYLEDTASTGKLLGAEMRVTAFL